MILDLKTVFFELLHAKPCRIIWKFPQKLSFEPEMCEIGPKVGTWKETLRENIPYLNAFLRKCCFWPPDNVF